LLLQKCNNKKLCGIFLRRKKFKKNKKILKKGLKFMKKSCKISLSGKKCNNV